GYYGKPPADVDIEVQTKILGDEKPITCRPGEKIEPELDKATSEISAWVTQPEDVLTYVMFPAIAKDFLMKRYAKLNLRDTGLGEVVEEAAYPV
ncbi:MAG: oxaloacetate decarboxylase subunit alpha, partial [Synergistales bacterium]|nr:oxaloacetate decarboxylase subunit alpha [Synergistales bacterium]